MPRQFPCETRTVCRLKQDLRSNRQMLHAGKAHENTGGHEVPVPASVISLSALDLIIWMKFGASRA